MRSPEPSSPSTAEALLHGQFASWGSHNSSSSSSNSCPNSPGQVGLSPATSPTPSLASNYALTLTHSHIHIQRLSLRPGKEARLMLPLAELVGCSCPRAPAPPLLVLYWYPPGKRRKGVSRRRQVRAFLAESRTEAERWAAAVQCLLRDVSVTSETGKLLTQALLVQFYFLIWRCNLCKYEFSLMSLCIPEKNGSETRNASVREWSFSGVYWLTFIWFFTLSVRRTQPESKRVELLRLAIPSYVLPVVFVSSTRAYVEACGGFVDAFSSCHYMLTIVMLLFPDLTFCNVIHEAVDHHC